MINSSSAQTNSLRVSIICIIASKYEKPSWLRRTKIILAMENLRFSLKVPENGAKKRLNIKTLKKYLNQDISRIRQIKNPETLLFSFKF